MEVAEKKSEKMNFPVASQEFEGADKDLEKFRKEEEEENSPIEEVRAVVSNKDDPTLPVMTFRFWVIGTFFTLALSFVNQFFFFHKSPMTVGILVVQLLSYPIGKFMEKVLPPGRLNPGPFNIKEHVLITAMANASAYTAYAVDIIIIKKIFYQSETNFLGGFLLVVTTQCLGYGMAGVLRPYLVRPSVMVWPANLVNVALFRTLHTDEDPTKGMTRLRFFCYVAIGSFCYFFLPGYLFTILTSISWLCWAFPENQVVQQIGSGTTGLSVAAFSLDWNTIVAFLGSPLATPFFAAANIFAGFILVVWILTPMGYYGNFWEAQKFPITGSGLYDKDGNSYDKSRVMKGNSFDEQGFQDYSPLYLSYQFAISYGIGFAGLSAVISYIGLHHGREIIERFKNSRNQNDDIHAKLMDRYPEVPNWWYLTVFAINVILSVVVCEVYDIRLPWWGVLLAIAMAAFFVLPIGIVQAVTNQQPGLNIITEFVIGYILPGEPIANVTFKTYGYISMAQALTFVNDLKLGHYMKIPPKAMFISQTVGTILAGLVNLGTSYYMMSAVKNICTKEAAPYTCPNARVFYSASVIWGLIGPEKQFGPISIYNPLNYFFLIGFILPIPFYFLAKKYPGSWFEYVHIPVFLAGTAILPPAQAISYPSWFIVSFIFQYYLFRHRNGWWERFNYVLSAAMDSGVAVASLIIFFALNLQEVELEWWGNAEDQHCTLADLPLSPAS